jgi:hypothetical protein
MGVVAALAGCTTFGNGPHVIGSGKYDVQPGFYTSTKVISSNINSACLWLRDLDTSKPSVEAKGNDEEFGGRSFVQILPTDTTFLSQGCGLWTPVVATSYSRDRAAARTGAYRIPTDLLPGTYTAPGGPLCSWTRVSSFKGDNASIIASSGADRGLKNPRVTIASTDVGFLTDICGDWHRVGP